MRKASILTDRRMDAFGFCALVQIMAGVLVGAVVGGCGCGFPCVFLHEFGRLFHRKIGAGTGHTAAGTAHALQGLAVVRRLASRSVPSVDFRQVITSFSGVRSSEKNGDFIVVGSEKVQGLVHVAAIDSPGLTSCVAIAKMAVRILADRGLTLKEKESWNGKRENAHAFREMTDEEKDAYIREHPAYGKIVCRCETVSEGEMRDAIRRNPPAFDLDGVKRRTRGGMGRCQGGFCSPYVMKLIAQEQGMKVEEVTKFGKGSEPLLGKL